jgi:pimeloyl-ACP methyl ester carboxylesterase
MPRALVNGVNLHYEEHGRGFPLLLLMGFGDGCDAWSNQLPAFAARFRTIAHDYRGVGQSEKPSTGYSIAQFAADTVGLLDALGVPNAHVVGYSMGGRVGQYLAGHFPHRVQSLVLAAAAAKPNALVRYSLRAGAYLYERFGPEAAAAMNPLISFTHAYFEQHIGRLLQELGKPVAAPMPLHAYRGHVDAIEAHDTTGLLPKIVAPTLVILGDQESLNPMPDASLLVQRIPRARLQVLPGTGHGLIWETPAAFNDAVLEFLGAHTPPGGGGAA